MLEIRAYYLRFQVKVYGLYLFNFSANIELLIVSVMPKPSNRPLMLQTMISPKPARFCR